MTYGGLLQERRRELHARVVAAIETLHGDRLSEQTERLAHHALRGEVWDRAVGYLREAGLRAAARGAFGDAASHLEGALEALRHLPEDRTAVELAIDLRFDLRTVLVPLREVDRMADALHLLGEIAEAEDPPDTDRAKFLYREALGIAGQRGFRPLVAHCHLGLGKLCRRADKREQAHEHLTTAATMYGEMGMTYWLEKVEEEMKR